MDEYQMTQTAAASFAIGVLIMYLVVVLAAFLFFGFCFKKIAEKTGNADMAGIWWIPIVNLLIPVRVAGKPGWWLLLFLIPFVNIIVSIIVWMAVAERLGRENWWGIIAALIPIVGVTYLAFTDAPTASSAA